MYPDFKDTKDLVPLQAADIIACELNREFERQLYQPSREPRHGYRDLPTGIETMIDCVWAEHQTTTFRLFLILRPTFTYEHGATTDSKAFVWQDKAGKNLAIGPWIVLRLSPGEHTIGLTVTDASGVPATVYRRLVVKGP